MDEHTLVHMYGNIRWRNGIAKPSPSREWVDKQRSMRTSLRGVGTTGWSLVRAKVAHHFVHCQCRYTMFVHRSWFKKIISKQTRCVNHWYLACKKACKSLVG